MFSRAPVFPYSNGQVNGLFPPLLIPHNISQQRTETNLKITNLHSRPKYQWKAPAEISRSSPNRSRKRKSNGNTEHELKRQRFGSNHPYGHPAQTGSYSPVARSEQGQGFVREVRSPIHTPGISKPQCSMLFLKEESSQNSLPSHIIKDKLSQQILDLFNSCEQQSEDLEKKEFCRAQLQMDIQRIFPCARIFLAGSSLSGFGSRTSDADLCLVVQEGPINQKTDAVYILSIVQKLLYKLSYIERPQLIRAKVPILKFKDRISGVEFDLNVNNTVGIRNTFLLRTYAYIEKRVRPIILAIKKWAGHQRINDASRGTLSSYTLVLMVLHYLQTLPDPVIPCLQKDYPECFSPGMDIHLVPDGPKSIPPFLSKNQSSLGDLLLGFLKYYATVFRWDKQVISVREAKALPRSNCWEWRSNYLYVEEPFDGTNTARAVHEKIKFDAIRAVFTETDEMESKEEGDRIESEIQDDETETGNIDEEEVEELHNSLKEVVHDPAVKPKFQCLMVDPSFSMVTVQSEDSGIVWETASSRCSTPWASEASSPSDSYSLEGSGTQGNIVIIMDENKVRRRKKISSRGKLSSRFLGPAIGEERPAMVEVSVPNIKSEEAGQTVEETPNKDQELFNLISEGFEILNIVVPSKLPTVDEECSIELSDNLSYLEDTPKIKTKYKHESLTPATISKAVDISIDIQEVKADSPTGLSQAFANEPLKKDETDMDYLEKFTLLDQHGLEEEDSEKPGAAQDIQQEESQVLEEEQKVEDTADENSFVIVSEVDIADDHLDEVFYGASSAEPELSSQNEKQTNGSFKTLKECGSTLFGSQETILTPIFLPPGPSKIIDQDLLDEPRAMSFHYSDLYENALGDRKKDEDTSDIESVVSEKSFKRRYSDSDDGEGYLEKFILKDETPPVVVKDVKEDAPPAGDRVIWPQNKFEMTGCLIRVKEEDATQDEDVSVNQMGLSKEDKKDECQPPQSSEDCAGGDGLNTGCMTANSVSETLEGCDNCDMKTGCAIRKIVTSNEIPLIKSLLREDEKQIHVQKLEDMDKRDKLEEKKTDKFEILPTKNDNQKVTDVAAGGLDTVILTEKKTPGKEQQSTTTAQKIGRPNLVRDTSTTSTAEETGAGAQNKISQEKIGESEKCKDETKQSGEKIEISKPEKVNKAVLGGKSKVLENKKTPALEESLKDTAVQSILSKSGKQEQVTDITIVPEISKIKNDLKTMSEQKVFNEVDTSEHKVGEVKVKTMRIKEQTEQNTVFDRKTPESVTTETTKTPVESTNNVSISTFEKKKDGLREPETYSDIPTGYDHRSDTKDAKGDVGCPPPQEIPEREVVNEIADMKEKVELTDVLNDSQDEIKSNLKMILPILSTEKDDFSQVTMPTHVTKKGDSEIKDVAIARIKSETTADALQSVHPVAGNKVNGVPKESDQKVEEKSLSKSKKTLLKDTHKEELWRPLELSSPSPPVEIEDSLMRVSPLENEKYIKDNDNFGLALKKDKGPFSTLRSFSPLEDLSGFGRDLDDADLQKEIYEELDYEMITEQDARPSETEVSVAKEEYQEQSQDESQEPTIEADYEFIEDLDRTEISEDNQFKVKVEIEPMDAFCLVCRCPVLISDSGHENHEVSTLENAFKDIKDQLNNWISVLQERSENIEDLVSELELAYNSVEEQCKNNEKALDEQNEEMMKLVMERYNEMSQTMEEEKKAKLEQLYDQIVSFQEKTDSAKETMEATSKDMEETDDLAFLTILYLYDFISSAWFLLLMNGRFKTALDSVMSLELGPRGLLVFEDYAKGTKGNEKKNRQVIPVPQQPHLLPQEANSATSTSVTVYWTVNQGDIIDCFQVYCMEEPQGAISEEYRITVKESYCNLEELEADKCYKVWVMAVNYTGCSMPSQRLPFRTAPSVPVINPEACTVLWESARIRWSLSQPSAAESFTLESVSGIKGYEHKVLLQPNENFLFYIKSVNSAGASEQSEAALISTRGTRFHLLSETAHVALKVSEDKNSVQYPVETYNTMATLIECPAVRGELLPAVGYHYWETVVVGCKAYRIGVAYQTEPHDSAVGDSSASWCLHCVPTSISCRFELLHDSVESDIFVTDVPTRIGALLDFTRGRLLFFNTQNGQCLGSFQQAFSQPCYPVFTLERPGNLELKMTTEVPEFAKQW
ncbi:Poly(A) RNA polymerase GLD2 [Bagarius yarrelli]|uniref:polynucleotide adenylyltransferase n=1 Tax=Bagarius yarrelli TaxID=175774 RepID=A0A556U5H0_BAGYA|nr:Poly(A) RNA polymerase GLD2 [Bagarius yarrelli]